MGIKETYDYGYGYFFLLLYAVFWIFDLHWTWTRGLKQEKKEEYDYFMTTTTWYYGITLLYNRILLFVLHLLKGNWIDIKEKRRRHYNNNVHYNQSCTWISICNPKYNTPFNINVNPWMTEEIMEFANYFNQEILKKLSTFQKDLNVWTTNISGLWIIFYLTFTPVCLYW